MKIFKHFIQSNKYSWKRVLDLKSLKNPSNFVKIDISYKKQKVIENSMNIYSIYQEETVALISWINYYIASDSLIFSEIYLIFWY